MRVDDKRIGVLDPVIGAPDARREQPRAPVRAVDVEPQAVLAGDGGGTGQVIDDARVGRAGGGHHHGQRGWVAVGLDRRAERHTGEPVIAGGHGQRIHLQDPQRADDRGVSVGADHSPEAAPPVSIPRLALGHLARD